MTRCSRAGRGERRRAGRPGRRADGGRPAVWIAALAALALALGSAAADAQLTLVPDSVDVIAADSSDPSDPNHANPDDRATQAGSHPFMVTTTFAFDSDASPYPDDFGALIPGGNMKDVVVDLPAGFVGDPTAVPACSQEAFNRNSGLCPASSQVGWADIDFGFGFFGAPVYNIRPSRGEPARFAFFGAGLVPIHLTVSVRTGGDYGLRVTLRDLPQGLPVNAVRLTLWGVPADPRHDGARGGPSGVEPKPFLTLPTRCTDVPQQAQLRITSWQEPGRVLTAAPTMFARIDGCDRLAFRPSIEVRVDTARAGAPAGYRVAVDVPQTASPDLLATPAVRDAVVQMPRGVVIAPGSANRLEGCADAQFDLRAPTPARCADASKIGTVRLDTPLLADPMDGAIWLGQPLGSDPRSGEMLRLLLELEGAGVRVKLLGRVVADPATGQLTARFDDTPQLPFSRITLSFATGPLAPLANPRDCGPATTTATLTSVAGQVAEASSRFVVSHDGHGAPCPPRPFSPRFVAGAVNPAGGADSPFTLTFGRDDADQLLRAVAVDLPEGLLARLGDLAALCADAQAAAGACDEGARIGTVLAAAGPGPLPFQLPGRVYMTGPYGGAPFGLSIVVPAIAGPLDLGVVVVRAAVFVDRTTTALRIVADPMPSILAGIPLQLREVTVAIDRPRFMVNPTSCAPTQVGGAISSLSGAVAPVASRFQLGGCAALPFRPRMAIRVGGRGRTRGGLTTPLAVTLRMTPGQANNGSVRVTLPPNLNARLRVIREACSLAEFRAGAARCQQVGAAVAQTPLLRDPLRGEAYFVDNPARRLPDLMVALRGQGRAAGVAVELTGRVAVSRSLRLRTTFDTIPDVPVDRFTLRLVAGRRGTVGFVADACTARARRQRAEVVYRAQSGRVVRVRQPLRTVGCRGAGRRQSAASRRTDRRRTAAPRPGAAVRRAAR